MPKGICIICETRELKVTSRLPTCSVCRGSMGYWQREGAARIAGRRAILKVYDTRMMYVDERDVEDWRTPLKEAPTPKRKQGSRKTARR